MPALTVEFKNITLSYTSGVMTIFRHTGPEQSIEDECAIGGFAIVDGYVLMDDALRYSHSIAEIRAMKFVNEFITASHDDVNLYHEKESATSHHHHIRFNSMLTEEQVHRVLSILHQQELLSEEDIDDFLRKFRDRYTSSRAELDKNTREGRIKECQDNITALKLQLAQEMGQLQDKELPEKLNILLMLNRDVTQEPEAQQLQGLQVLRYRARLSALQTELDTLQRLGDKATDEQVITRYISTITDNDILFDLHAYLQGGKFDYLRTKIGCEIVVNMYQGTHRDGFDNEAMMPFWVRKESATFRDVLTADTTRCWANIEKALTLQIAHNVQTQSKFTPVIGEMYAQQYTQYRFFDKPHGKKAEKRTSKTYDAFARGDSATLDRKYKKMFSRVGGSD
ncbi:MAG: hypothetical protein A3E83_06285 [Gammaproteobacteria bacterium RIFCSPHIGHO2_12_FULL_41_20]|nr:MAG: hypothetical protein A3E83_06285 [Gammaproteobacteria bacterium RIFCSPHIGHO2_12_FULL_41_20]